MADKLQRFHANLETSAQPAIRKTKISILASIVSPLSVAFSVATASTLSFASPAPQCRNLFASHSFDSQDHAQLLISQFNAQFGESFRDGSILTKPLNRSQFEYLVSPLIRAVDRQINSIDLLENKSRRLTSAQKSNFAQAKSNLVNLKSQFEKLSRSSAKPFHYESVFDAIQRSVSAVIDPTSKLIASPAASASLKIVSPDLVDTSLTTHAEESGRPQPKSYIRVPTDVSLSVTDFNHLVGSGIFPIGVTDKAVSADNGVLSPFVFFIHDCNHAVSMVGRLEGANLAAWRSLLRWADEAHEPSRSLRHAILFYLSHEDNFMKLSFTGHHARQSQELNSPVHRAAYQDLLTIRLKRENFWDLPALVKVANIQHAMGIEFEAFAAMFAKLKIEPR